MRNPRETPESNKVCNGSYKCQMITGWVKDIPNYLGGGWVGNCNIPLNELWSTRNLAGCC